MNSTPPSSGDSLHLREQIEHSLREWCAQAGGCEHRFPSLIAAETLNRAEYPYAFPQLLMGAAVADDPTQGFVNTRPAPWFLSPAVCYHVYADFAGQTLRDGAMISAQGTCFRFENEAELAVGRRQIEFGMRELVLLGTGAWIEEKIERLQPQVTTLGERVDPAVQWCPANDPFFLPRARGKAHLQRLRGLKWELCLPDGLAIASINRHGPFFGERFEICDAAGEPIHTACIAFGIDRWISKA
jgi:hypothetical protein